MDNVDNLLDVKVISIDKNKIFKCEFCEKILSSKRNLEIHEYNICKYQHKCVKCNKTFISQKYLNRHLKLCVGELKCIYCCKLFSRKQTYLSHMSKCKNIKNII